MDQWVGKVAVVTGASAGIGAAIAEQLVTEGVKVVGLARRKENIEKLSQKLASKKGKLYSLKCDISKEEDIVKAFNWIEEHIGPVSILVNNAGIIQGTRLLDGDAVAWKNVFEVNVIGLCIATREAIRIMRKHNVEGHIININSGLGQRLMYIPIDNVYAASKHALKSVTHTFRGELALNKINNIKISSVSPGRVHTEFGSQSRSKADPAIMEMMEKMSALQAEDVADAVLYVLSTPPGVQIDELCIQVAHEGA